MYLWKEFFYSAKQASLAGGNFIEYPPIPAQRLRDAAIAIARLPQIDGKQATVIRIMTDNGKLTNSIGGKKSANKIKAEKAAFYIRNIYVKNSILYIKLKIDNYPCIVAYAECNEQANCLYIETSNTIESIPWNKIQQVLWTWVPRPQDKTNKTARRPKKISDVEHNYSNGMTHNPVQNIPVQEKIKWNVFRPIGHFLSDILSDGKHYIEFKEGAYYYDSRRIPNGTILAYVAMQACESRELLINNVEKLASLSGL